MEISTPTCTVDTFKRGAGILRAVQASLATRNTFVYHKKILLKPTLRFVLCRRKTTRHEIYYLFPLCMKPYILNISIIFERSQNDKQLKDSRSVFLIKLNKFIGPCFFSICSRGSVAIERSDRFCESVKGK